MNFHEESIHSGAGCRTGQGLDEFTLATGLGSPTTRQLHTMCSIENHRVAEAPKDGKGSHIHDEIIVTERRSSLGQDDPPASGLLYFFHCVTHFLRREELALLYIHHFACLRRCNEQVGLPAEERGNLEYIHNLPRLDSLFFRVNIRQDRKAQLIFHLLQRRQPFFKTRSAIRRDGGPVRFVEGRFEYIRNAQRLGNLGDARRGLQHELFTLNDTRPGNQKRPIPRPDFKRTNLDFVLHGL